MECAIRISGLHKAYRDNAVLKGIDLHVREGEIFCLLGSNGAGKTTLVRILATLSSADEGEVILCGNDLAKKPRAVRECISLTGQYASVDNVLTSYENLLLAARLLRVKRPKERAMELISEFRLESVTNKRAALHSGGTRRRLDIAMSLVRQPRILFLDEPTTGLDPQSRLLMWEAIRIMRGRGITIFLTTQYLEEAEKLADTIAVLHKGKIIAGGTAADIKAIAPQGSLVLRFPGKEMCALACERLELPMPEEELSIALPVDGSVERLKQVLDLLDGIEIESLEQRQATLEEAFLHLIKEGESHDEQ